MRIHPLLAAPLLALACIPAGAQAMKPGLWEVRQKIGGGEMDQAMAEMHKEMAAMSPEQRRQMEAMMGSQGMRIAPGGGVTLHTCMTREMSERNEMPMEQGCRITQQQRSAGGMKMAFACSNPPSSGETQVTFSGPEAYTSRMTVRTVAGGKTETTTMEGSGKWLKADCGNVKPVLVPKK